MTNQLQPLISSLAVDSSHSRDASQGNQPSRIIVNYSFFSVFQFNHNFQILIFHQRTIQTSSKSSNKDTPQVTTLHPQVSGKASLAVAGVQSRMSPLRKLETPLNLRKIHT